MLLKSVLIGTILSYHLAYSPQVSQLIGNLEIKNQTSKFSTIFFEKKSPPPDTTLLEIIPQNCEYPIENTHTSLQPLEKCLIPELLNKQLNARRDSLVELAKKYLGTRYMWGGNTPAGFDCSGFAQYLYAKFGYTIPRMSGEQSLLGQSVEPQYAKKGDLVFYGYPTGHGRYVFTHTAIVYDNQPTTGVQVIHATLWGIAITSLHFDYYGYCRLICIKRII
ncbi:MAG: C40 family peptidase [Microscillaceae bacterium]|nr:C40 family peptidase [Microscillaceae bacterium]MDW8459725.1 C40 family peptidase [Cytophagales bacterium]